MIRMILTAVFLGLACAPASAAQPARVFDPRLAGSAVYSDPGFQEFVETSYGYLRPGSGAAAAAGFRDSVASPAPAARKAASAGAKGEKYILVSIQPRSSDYSGLLGEISASAGFVLSGERISHLKNGKVITLLGRVPASGLAAIRKNPGVAAVYRVRKASAKAL
ncbi:MAG: hypothetical protein PHV36_14195 [Elusimicrobiales bacterium]|nr:hypothetical protein [Elusimicrobiales bacterium]